MKKDERIYVRLEPGLKHQLKVCGVHISEVCRAALLRALKLKQKKVLIMLLLIGASGYADDIKWVRLDVKADTIKEISDKCDGRYTIIELGMIEGETKVVRYTCD